METGRAISICEGPRWRNDKLGMGVMGGREIMEEDV
jgi:hypothetical protein